jgi:hypothetical protein
MTLMDHFYIFVWFKNGFATWSINRAITAETIVM